MNPDDTAALPPLLAQILAYATIALTLLTALAHGIVWLVPRLRVIAMRTATRKDDDVVDWLARAGASLAAVLDVAQLFLPRVSLGKPAPSGVDADHVIAIRVDGAAAASAALDRVAASADRAVAKLEIPPPSGGAGAALVLLALLVAPPLPLLSGCGASALQVQAVAADYTGIAVEASGVELLAARGHALEVAVSSSSTRDEAQAAVDAVRLHYAPAVLAFDSLRIAHGLWVDVLGLAAAGNIDDPLRWARLAAAVVVSWESWASSAEGLGLEVPHPPGVLLAVAAMVPAPAAVPAVSP